MTGRDTSFVTTFGLSIFAVAVSIVGCIAVASSSSSVEMTVGISVCGNGVRQGGEDCDGGDLGSNTCVSIGLGAGQLSCSPACEFDTISCAPAPFCGDSQCNGAEQCSSCSLDCGRCASGGAGGGGLSLGSVVLSGHAYPKSSVVVLKDGQKVISTVSGPDARFQVTIANLFSGSYNFSVYGEDSEGRRSMPFTFPLYLGFGANTTIGGIFLTPTIETDKTEVKRGDNISIFGKTVPKGTVTIAVHSDPEIFVNTDSDANGVYFYTLDTTPLQEGAHVAKSKTTLFKEVSEFGSAVGFQVGDKTVTKKPRVPNGDLNKDMRVNLVDFSIALHWFKKNLSPDAKIIEAESLSGDGKIDLADISIILYFWTG